jgi:hypothetical protein
MLPPSTRGYEEKTAGKLRRSKYSEDEHSAVRQSMRDSIKRNWELGMRNSHFPVRSTGDLNERRRIVAGGAGGSDGVSRQKQRLSLVCGQFTVAASRLIVY